MKLEHKIKFIAACIALVGATQTTADTSQRTSTGTVKSTVGDKTVWTEAAKAYIAVVEQIKAKEGK
jgi:hypothetical protein